MAATMSLKSFKTLSSMEEATRGFNETPCSPEPSLSAYETELVRWVRMLKQQSNAQWETWSSFQTWFESLRQFYYQGLAYQREGFSLSAKLPFKQLEFLYQQLELYLSCQDVEATLQSFQTMVQSTSVLSWQAFQYYSLTYQSVYDFLNCFSHHWVKSFEQLSTDFLTTYPQLARRLDWKEYEGLLTSLAQPQLYLSEKDVVTYTNSVSRFLVESQRLEPFLSPLLKQKCLALKNVMTRLPQQRETHNRQRLLALFHENDALLSSIDGKSLDYQQRLAVLTDEDQMVVLAGAGSGKTLTIAAKVKYLVERCQIDPSEILLISFTNKAADEMRERIQERLDLPVEVKTFHKLGLDLISRASAQKPTIVSDKRLAQLIETYLLERVFNNEAWSRVLATHFARYLGLEEGAVPKTTLLEHYEFRLLQKLKNLSLDSFEDVEELALKLSDGKRTLQQEYVKSTEEMKIANFLFLNGIRYEYEADYPYQTADESHRQYRPDFFLPDYQIYLEHFGISDNGRASWLPQQKAVQYEEGIEWKRSIHQQYQTKMIETYSYQEKNQVLLKQLKEKLEQEGVPFQHVDVFTLLKRLMTLEKHEFSHFVQLIETFISFFKGNLYSLDTLREWQQSATDERTSCFYQLVLPILEHYEETLTQLGEVDFNDMIAQAIEISNTCRPDFLGYRYVIVDEYQDISYARFQLIQTICEKSQAKLFCVGDDWQSIYRFAGSDLSLFQQTARSSHLLRLEQTYRNSQRLIDVAGAFVMQNTDQYQKNLISGSIQREKVPLQIYQYHRSSCAALKYALRDISAKYSPYEQIFLLGRYSRDIQLLDEAFEVRELPTGGFEIQFKEIPTLRLQFLTIHKSKGMECDHAIILNMKDSKLGFPSQLQDDPLLSNLLVEKELYPHAEERRLFYVALTRAKKTCRLLVPSKRPSCFAVELMEHYQVPIVWGQEPLRPLNLATRSH